MKPSASPPVRAHSSTPYSDEPFVSRSYARELTRAHVQAIELERVSDDPPARLAAWLGTVSTTEVRRLDLRLVLDLLRIEEDPERREPLLVPVVALVDDLLLVGDFEAADQLLAALRADAEQASDAPRSDFARRTLAKLVSDSTMRHLVSHLATIEDAQMARDRKSTR